MPSLTPGSIIERLFQVDPKVARVILIGLSVLAAVAIVGNWGIDAGSILPVVIWLAVCYLLFAFLANMPGWLGRLLGTVATLAFVAYVGLFAVQLVSINRFNPPIMVAGCFFSPNQQGCPLNVLPGVERGDIRIATAEPSAPDTGEAIQPGPADGVDLSNYRVFVQYFPQRIDSEQAGGLASGLASEGWPVAEGVEGLSSAFGVNEVRYFHPQDEEAARVLASEVPGAASWDVEMRVRDFSHVQGAAPGLLEVWVGG